MRQMGSTSNHAPIAPPPPPGDGASWTQLPRWGCRMLGEPRWHGRTEWLLDFGWPDPAPRSGRVMALLLAQVAPPLLQSIEVRDCRHLCFGLDLCEGGRGQLASAGELLLAIAAAQGRQGLHIDALDLGAAVSLQRLSLRLRVWGDAEPALRVRVRVADGNGRQPPCDASLALAAADLPAQGRSMR